MRKHPFPEADQAIARRLIEIRRSHGLSCRALALRAGIDPKALERIELGRMPLRYQEAC